VRSLLLALVSALLLSGCVDYNVGIRFDSPNRGEIVQHIQIGERLQSFSGTTVQQWLDSIEQRGRSLGGRVQRLSNQEFMLSIPFSNSADLETRFNQFFAPATRDNRQGATPESSLPDIQSHLEVVCSNLLLLERQHLRYDLDLRSLGLVSSDGNVFISPATLVNLEFKLETPWGAQVVRTNNSLDAEVQQGGRQLVWRIFPGEQNHLEAVFWLPSPLGIGTVVIVLLVLVGRYFKYPAISPETIPSSQTPQH
jgi:hypothetical protein